MKTKLSIVTALGLLLALSGIASATALLPTATFSATPTATATATTTQPRFLVYLPIVVKAFAGNTPVRMAATASDDRIAGTSWQTQEVQPRSTEAAARKLGTPAGGRK